MSRLTLLLLLLVSSSGFSQDYKRNLNLNLKENNIEFKHPKDFVSLDSARTFHRGDRKVYTMFNYSMVNKDETIAIAIDIVKMSKINEKQLALIKKLTGRDPDDINLNYKKLIANHAADTLKIPVLYHSPAYSKGRFNADASGQYNVKFPLPYKNKFNNGKVLFIHKQDGADVHLHYFYTDAVKGKMDRIIKKTSKMIRFGS